MNLTIIAINFILILILFIELVKKYAYLFDSPSQKLQGRPSFYKMIKSDRLDHLRKRALRRAFDRHSVMLCGYVPREEVTKWYQHIKEKLQYDGMTITHLAISTDVMAHFNCQYKPVNEFETQYLEMIDQPKEHANIIHLGFSCVKEGSNNLHRDCYLNGTIGWDRTSYVPFIKLTIRRTLLDKINIEDYILSCQQLCHWQWITQYRMDYSTKIYLKQIDGYIIEDNASKVVLDERHQAMRFDKEDSA